jgi:hypothetical protein
VDLAAWGRGDVEAPFDAVLAAINAHVEEKVKAIAERFAGIEAPRDAVTYLVEEGIIDEYETREDV